MLNSRDIGLLRPDVAENCYIFIRRMAARGFTVLVTGTVRDNEYQLYCYNNGYSKAKTPSFHAEHAGLAFDICKNVKGHEYDDAEFWAAAGEVGTEMGFTWGGNWTSFVDKPHFQWDEYGKYTGSMIRSYNYPAEMPLYEDGLDMTVDEARTALTSVADTGDDHSEWAENAIQAFIDAEIINGDGNGNYGWGQCLTREGAAKILYSLLERLGLLEQLR